VKRKKVLKMYMVQWKKTSATTKRNGTLRKYVLERNVIQESTSTAM